MNTPAIPRPRKNHVCEIEKEIRKQYARLVKGHKKDPIRAGERLVAMATKLLLEAHQKRSRDELFRPRVKLIEKHPCFNTGKTLPSRVDRVTRW